MPYRDDHEALRAMLDAALARAAAAEERARSLEDQLRRTRRRGRAAPGEVLVVRLPGRMEFVEPGQSAFGLGRLVIGAMPTARVAMTLRARRVFARDGEADLDATCVIGIGASDAARSIAARQFLDSTPADLIEAARPLVEAALRRVLAQRSTTDVERALGGLAADVRAAAASPLADLGLELGEILLAPPGGTVDVGVPR